MSFRKCCGIPKASGVLDRRRKTTSGGRLLSRPSAPSSVGTAHIEPGRQSRLVEGISKAARAVNFDYRTSREPRRWGRPLKEARPSRRSHSFLPPHPSHRHTLARCGMDELDEEMQQLVAALHRADLQGLRDADKGKRRDGDTTDEQAAFAFYEEDLDRFDLWLADHRLALSFDTAVRLDGAVVHELSELERGAARDREMALHLDRGRSSSRETSASSSRCTSRVSSRASSVVGSASSIRVSREASTSASSYFSPSPVPARQQATSKPVEHVQCIICSDSIREDRAVVVPCAHSHNYCRPCLKDLFLLATRDESLFPPRCDGAEIPSSLVLNLLSSAERDLVRDKSREFSTKDRLYCSQASCSRFLGSSTDNRVLITCGCGAQTCEACKAPWHGVFGACGKGADADVAAVLAQDYGYAQCPGCRRLVELDVGCFHM